MLISIIVSMAKNRVIGNNNAIPWHIPEDFVWFRKKTMGHSIIMGRKTYESIRRPLPGRKSIILTRNNLFHASGAAIFHTLEEALAHVEKSGETEAFIIGGESLYTETLPLADRLYCTVIDKKYQGDTYFPSFDKNIFSEYFKEHHEGSPSYTFYIFEKQYPQSP